MGDHTENMLSVALHHPAQAQDLIINEGFPLLGIGQKDGGFDKLGLNIGDKLIQISARQVQAPKIVYRQPNNSARKPAKVNEASWNVMGVHFFKTPTLAPARAVCTIDMRQSDDGVDISQLGLELSKIMVNHGIRFQQGPVQSPSYCNTYRNALKRKAGNGLGDVLLYEVLKQDVEIMGSATMLLVVLSDKQQWLYGAVKRICDQWLGVHTVCLTVPKLYNKGVFVGARALGPHMSNLALKMNMKLGGQNHQVCKPGGNAQDNVSAFHHISADTIVFGADVSHPAGGMPSTPSVAAVVASDDEELANFPGSMRLQAGTQEMIEELEDMVYERLIHFTKQRGFLPKRVIFYRDGVSEDQFAKCRQLEIPQIERAFDRAKADALALINNRNILLKHQNLRLRLTFIVVGKRHHTRFFARTEEDTYQDDRGQVTQDGRMKVKLFKGQPDRDRDGNPKHVPVRLNGNLKPGLLVDQIVTRPPADATFDFFLQSHAALKGTARSAHYSVLQRGDLSTNNIQTLTHAFCYNYMRATKGVSYAGPAYYADRLCDRGSHYLRGYTTSRAKLDIQMSEEEKKMDKSEGAKAFAKRVASHISQDVAWNPCFTTRKNPWHEKFDKVMFWL